MKVIFITVLGLEYVGTVLTYNEVLIQLGRDTAISITVRVHFVGTYTVCQGTRKREEATVKGARKKGRKQQ